VRHLVKEFPIHSSGLVRRRVGPGLQRQRRRFRCGDHLRGVDEVVAELHDLAHARATDVHDQPCEGLERRAGSVKAISRVSFTVAAGETFGLVGESGCGKTTIGRVIVALERPDSGTVALRGQDICALSGGELRRHRRDLQLIFQDPYSSLDPRMRVGAIVREPLVIQRLGSGRQQQRRVLELLDEVGLPRGAVERYPHEFSGGQRQRIGLARALTLNPQVIVADEPVSALDVSIRAQVLNLMKRLQADHGLTYIVISHDLAVVKYMADRIGVMYLGKLVEMGSGEDIYQRAAHPYTAGLLADIPVPEPALALMPEPPPAGAVMH